MSKKALFLHGGKIRGGWKNVVLLTQLVEWLKANPDGEVVLQSSEIREGLYEENKDYITETKWMSGLDTKGLGQD